MVIVCLLVGRWLYGLWLFHFYFNFTFDSLRRLCRHLPQRGRRDEGPSAGV